MRTALGIKPGLRADISAYGSGIHIEPERRYARLVAVSDQEFTDEMVCAVIDEGRRWPMLRRVMYQLRSPNLRRSNATDTQPSRRW